MFGRTKTTQPPPSTDVDGLRTGGKGRPTPSRKEAEARNKRPIGAAPVRAGATKEEKKAARAAQRAAMAAERAKAREAMITGDERHLPPRDKGPARRFARDYVDARRNLGEYLLPVVLVILVLGMLPNLMVKTLSLFLLYGFMIAVIIDSVLIRRRVQKLANLKFAGKADRVGGYAMMRSLQMRRTRLPRPMVKKGQYPS